MVAMSTEVADDRDRHRYVAQVDGAPAGLLAYQLADNVAISLVHTQVDPAYEGHGVGSALARYALDDARRHGWAVRVLCPFVTSWLERHPDYDDLQIRH
jgi:predicted GNAT family acetyltransferase